MEFISRRICRTCMTEVTENEMLRFIYDTVSDSEGTTFAELLLSSVPRIHIKLYDDLPKSICLQCLEELVKLADFQKMCVKSELEMLALIAASQTNACETVADSMLVSETSILQRDVAANLDTLLKNDCCIKKEPSEILEPEHVTSNDAFSGKKNPGECIMLQIKKEEECLQDGSELNFPSGLNSLGSTATPHIPQAFEATEEFLIYKVEKVSVKNKKVKLTEDLSNEMKSEHSILPWSNQEHSLDEIKDGNRFEGIGNVNSPVPLEDSKEWKVADVDISGNHKPKTDSLLCKYACRLCGKGYTNRRSLYVHEWRHRNKKVYSNMEKRYECPNCPKKFAILSRLNRHKIIHLDTSIKKRTHINAKPHICNHCDKRFTQSAHLKVHLSKHTGEKPYKCKFCMQTFVQHSQLVRHLQKFLGENIHRCMLCPQRFRYYKDVREHLVSHENEDDAKRLENLAALKEEETKLMEFHKNDIEKMKPKILKPFKCKYCAHTFTQNGSLTRHLRTFHAGN